MCSDEMSGDIMQAKAITPENFSEFGRVARPPTDDPLAADETFKFWSDVAHFEIPGETEIGFCTVYGRSGRVDWMERHDRTPELLVPIDGPFVLPVMTDDGRLGAFRADPGTAVVIGQGVWHGACHPVESDETTYFVIFRRGTPQEDVTKQDIEPIHIETK